MRAFTLIELAFVTALLAILLAASLPKFQVTADRLRLEQSMFHLTQTLRAARERAVAEGREIVWVWDDDARRSHLEAQAVDGRLEQVDERAAMQASLASGAAVEMMRLHQQVGCRCIHFFPDGTSEPATTVTVKSPGRVYTVTVHETTGQACLAEGTAAC